MEVVLELEDHHFATIIVKIRSGKNDQQTPDQRGNSDDWQDICMVLKFLPTGCLLVARDLKNKK